jgi:hypothetical protein
LTWILIWTKTSILIPYPSAGVLCSCERGRPYGRLLGSGDMSPCGIADYGVGSESGGVFVHVLSVDDLETF